MRPKSELFETACGITRAYAAGVAAADSAPSSANAALVAENIALRKALTDLFGLVDSGWLVRDISHDHEDGWGMKQLRPVMILKEVSALVQSGKARP